MIYKVLKDFPSRNGVTQYKVGQLVQLNINSRNESLEEMGYIEKATEEHDDKSTIARAIYATGEFEGVKVKQLGRRCFKVWVG